MNCLTSLSSTLYWDTNILDHLARGIIVLEIKSSERTQSKVKDGCNNEQTLESVVGKGSWKEAGKIKVLSWKVFIKVGKFSSKFGKILQFGISILERSKSKLSFQLRWKLSNWKLSNLNISNFSIFPTTLSNYKVLQLLVVKRRVICNRPDQLIDKNR